MYDPTCPDCGSEFRSIDSVFEHMRLENECGPVTESKRSEVLESSVPG